MRPERAVIGRIVRPHGLRGEVLIRALTDIPKRFAHLSTVVLTRGGAELGAFTIERSRTMAKGVGLKFKGIDTPEAARKLRGAELEATPSDADVLAAHEYFVFDLVGMRVVDEQGLELGIVSDVREMPGQDLAIVTSDEREWSLPLVREFVAEVDTELRAISVTAVDGLMEL